MESKQFSFLELFWYIYVSLELWAHWTTLFPHMCLPCPALTVCHSLSDGRHPEYTEVPLGALDIAAADSLTLSPHNGKFKMDVCRSFMCLSSPCSPQSLQYETKLQHYCLFKAMITVIRNLVWFSAKPKKACDLWKVKDGENKAAFSADQRCLVSSPLSLLCRRKWCRRHRAAGGTSSVQLQDGGSTSRKHQPLPQQTVYGHWKHQRRGSSHVNLWAV